MDSNVSAALIAGGTALVVSVVGGFISWRLERGRLREELRTEFMAEATISQLLLHQRWPLRSFEKIKHHIGGFTDDELRQLLVRAGAVRFKDDGGEELWGLRVRNQDRLNGLD
ncbi:MAG: hypothetical protein WCD21_33920 [Streptomyces sp.]